MTVIGLSKRKDKIDALRLTLFDVKGRLDAVECDIRDEVQVAAAFKWIEDIHGGVDLLINNAGVLAKGLLTDDNNTNELRKIIETNIIGLCLCTREAIKLMKKRETEDFGEDRGSTIPLAQHLINKKPNYCNLPP